jgi:hypothetical protein
VTGSNVCPVHRQGIIFLILNYNHIKATLRAADSSVAQRISSASGSSGSGSKGAQQQQQQPAAPGTAAGGLGSAGAAAIKECEVRAGHRCGAHDVPAGCLVCVLASACHALVCCRMSSIACRASSAYHRMLSARSCSQHQGYGIISADPYMLMPLLLLLLLLCLFPPCRTSLLRALHCMWRTSWAATSGSCLSL